MRRIAVVTTSRADYSLYRSTLRKLSAEPGCELLIVATGTHLVPAHGRTVETLMSDGFDVAAQFDCLEEGDDPSSTARSMARALAGFSGAFERLRPDWLVVLGDRFEMHAAGLAALPYRLPVAHIHGGEITAGAYDDALRHSLTKLSHLHFPATELSAMRIVQMGEEPWRVTVSGAPGLDEFETIPNIDREELGRLVGLDLAQDPLLVTFHPTTLDLVPPAIQACRFFGALADRQEPIVVSMPNADTGNLGVRRHAEEFVGEKPNRRLVAALGPETYVNLMRIGAAMVGNSSSGIIEAPSFGLPVVNVGSRQEGRERASNVIDVPLEASAVRSALVQAMDPSFRAGLTGLASPFRQSRPACDIITERLMRQSLGSELVVKRWHDGSRS
ncbi:MAG: UDP-N-acetylglucosamine 2-epimerase (hydrolyzing) [Fimbriimonadaceae bacterium]|nr:UDP-N-acetylglucosamine 2-epimerase (hydrolyzing) [Fimbriimonadaceae bacterium]QYK59261.1 MAG: UDP-N-acetylglucosamine 2-epimerase (hydrolyzing) [Fimbriimonadaceae bacterium]